MNLYMLLGVVLANYLVDILFFGDYSAVRFVLSVLVSLLTYVICEMIRDWYLSRKKIASLHDHKRRS